MKPQDKKVKNIKNAIKVCLETYFKERAINKNLFEFHSLDVLKINKKGVIVELTLGRPGLFLGKGGKQLYEIQDIVSDFLDTKVEFKLKEKTFWVLEFNK